MNLNKFTYFWCCLELFIGKFIPNINNEHAQDYSCPRATFAFCSDGEKLPRQGGLPGVVQRVTCLSKLPRKTHVNSYRRQTVHRGKVDPEVSELPRGNELSRDHVNRPLNVNSSGPKRFNSERKIMFHKTFTCFYVSEKKPLCFSLCSRMFDDVERCRICNIQNVCHANE